MIVGDSNNNNINNLQVKVKNTHNCNNGSLFLKIFKYKPLRNLIFYHLNTMKIYQYQNEKLYIGNRVPFNRIKSLSWYLKRDLFALLKDRILNGHHFENELIIKNYIYDKKKYYGRTCVERLIYKCRDRELLQLIYEKFTERIEEVEDDLVELSIVFQNTVALDLFINHYNKRLSLNSINRLFTKYKTNNQYKYLESIKWFSNFCNIDLNQLIVYNKYNSNNNSTYNGNDSFNNDNNCFYFYNNQNLNNCNNSSCGCNLGGNNFINSSNNGISIKCNGLSNVGGLSGSGKNSRDGDKIMESNKRIKYDIEKCSINNLVNNTSDDSINYNNNFYFNNYFIDHNNSNNKSNYSIYSNSINNNSNNNNYNIYEINNSNYFHNNLKQNNTITNTNNDIIQLIKIGKINKVIKILNNSNNHKNLIINISIRDLKKIIKYYKFELVKGILDIGPFKCDIPFLNYLENKMIKYSLYYNRQDVFYYLLDKYGKHSFSFLSSKSSSWFFAGFLKRGDIRQFIFALDYYISTNIRSIKSSASNFHYLIYKIYHYSKKKFTNNKSVKKYLLNNFKHFIENPPLLIYNSLICNFIINNSNINDNDNNNDNDNDNDNDNNNNNNEENSNSNGNVTNGNESNQNDNNNDSNNSIISIQNIF